MISGVFSYYGVKSNCCRIESFFEVMKMTIINTIFNPK